MLKPFGVNEGVGFKSANKINAKPVINANAYNVSINFFIVIVFLFDLIRQSYSGFEGCGRQHDVKKGQPVFLVFLFCNYLFKREMKYFGINHFNGIHIDINSPLFAHEIVCIYYWLDFLVCHRKF